MRPEESLTEKVDRFLALVTDPASVPASIELLLHPEYVFREWPNAISPNGSVRDREATLASLAQSRLLLVKHSFDVHEHVVSWGSVATRMTWRGTLAIDAGRLRAGSELTAHVSQHNVFRDGLIWRTESFDCYEPLPLASGLTRPEGD